jgi:hypothetical protein
MNLGGGEERHGGGSHKVFASGEQIMLTRFENLKHGFAGQPGPNGTGKNFIDLPEGIGLQDAPERGISNGQLCVTWYGLDSSCVSSTVLTSHRRDLEDMFRDSVEGTLRLITEQLVQIDLQRLRVRVRYAYPDRSHHLCIFAYCSGSRLYFSPGVFPETSTSSNESQSLPGGGALIYSEGMSSEFQLSPRASASPWAT